ncbi:hypothetical protein [Ilumatobacter sp.]|uniref:hypothetical protein n=1 Tax=Ilumatobacter sp. TaxID=1967498 RepID=UPI003C66D934
MNDHSVRGRGVGIEITTHLVRGARLDPDRDGRVASAAEFSVDSADDDALLDGLVLLRAELGEPDDPTRIATFPSGTTIQRLDVTGRSGADLKELRAHMNARHSIGTTLIVDDGPRRWMLLIRWDEHSIDRFADIAQRAGFVGGDVEPSALSLARIAGADATYVRRLVAQGEAHHAVVANRLPVAAVSTTATGRAHPDLDIAVCDIALTAFDEFLDDLALTETIDRAAARADATRRSSSAGSSVPILDLAGVDSVSYPDHDVRSPQRLVVALGAAVGAAGLVGPIDVLQRVGPRAGIGGDPFDRPWAIETLPTRVDDAPGGGERATRRFWKRRSG